MSEKKKRREKGKAIFTPSKFRHPTLGTRLSAFTSERTNAHKFGLSKSYLSAVYEVGGGSACAPFPGGRKKAEKSAENFDYSRLALCGVIYIVIKCGTKLNGDLPLQRGKFLSNLMLLFSYFHGYYFAQNFFLTFKT